MADVLAILPQQLVFGLALGTVYGLVALGYTMVYGILFMINFAHGEIFMIGAYVGWWVLAGLLQTQMGGLHPAWVLPLMLLPAMLFTGALGVGLERFAYRPLYLRGATRLGPLISAIGASIFLQNAVMLTQGARMKVYMTSLLFPRDWRIQIAGASVSAHERLPYFASAISKPRTVPGTPDDRHPSTLSRVRLPAASRYMLRDAFSGARSRKSMNVDRPSASRISI